ncbi:ATPase required for both assembly of type IV secretion complex and secretion of T-DNA complex, VirB11 [uncultured Gammaproteobacteria bacterium]|uniref:P-type DNA transfer ATPase VirB11 n=1 Tax=Bathymodiolus heckerae thiotrophic gill symbiont TaxID=1052212 RepID=UPI0010AF21A6|nr:P-type DNA transfer ATPase VirB11 [Bathymodiolus heckerae thiotrophic gill symbiont]CAC9955464.1 ATPase required for both assembly of type IV secretion complex and secretion of T-DNA complex, VirB11 [uncultured Gammaproteobacteria bacterium]SHN91363.1 ATPase required for both assembly of type IV secretion complex and secretion of T-DNA complex, VirB11 [Bathymodiolus heckerae thiotrophic gill symbiont]
MHSKQPTKLPLRNSVPLLENLNILKPFLNNSENTEIVINKPYEVLTESYNGWKYHSVPELSFRACMNIAKLTATYTKQSLDERHPIISGTLPDGERVQIVIPPVTLQGQVSITIRKPSSISFTLNDYHEQGLFSDCSVDKSGLLKEDEDLLTLLKKRDFVNFFKLAVSSQKNIIISGSTGSGKTTFCKSLLNLVPENERLISIENVDELKIYETHPNSTSLFYSAGGQGVSPITQQELLESSLRMKPDRIFVAELIRGDEAFYYLRNVNSGHPGSITTLHANSTRLAFEQLVLFIKESNAGNTLGREDIKQLLYMCVDIIVQIKNIKGNRRITEVYFDPIKKLNAQVD